jgi:hypothetical protein
VKLRPPRLARNLRAFGVWGLWLGSGCATYTGAIERGQRYYEDNQYERALGLWRDLDRRGVHLDVADRARFAYFRGMTDYRLGFRDEARHWLAVARAIENAARGSLEPMWLERLDGALSDIERDPAGSRPGAADVVQTIEVPAEEPAPPATPDASGPSGQLPMAPDGLPPPHVEPAPDSPTVLEPLRKDLP